MPNVVYVEANGDEHTVAAMVGDSVMETAVKHGVTGIVGECGGSASCCSCHVYVDPRLADLFGPMSELEDDMLEGTVCERMPNSRLSCQLRITEELDGARFVLPEEQL